MYPVSKISVSLLMACALFMFTVSSCTHQESGKKTANESNSNSFEKAFPRAVVFPASRMGHFTLSLLDGKGNKVITRSSDSMKLTPDTWLVLQPDTNIHNGFTTQQFLRGNPIGGSAGSPNPGGDGTIESVKCSSTWTVPNQHQEVPCHIHLPNLTYIFGAPEKATTLNPVGYTFPSPLSNDPAKVDSPATKVIDFYACIVMETGFVTCSNTCSSPSSIHCTFVCPLGTFPPDHNWTANELNKHGSGITQSFTPCNDMNPCSGPVIH